VTSKRERAEKQAAAAAALAHGETIATAAEAAKVHETTVYRWARADDSEFARLVQEQKARLAGHWETIGARAAAELARRTHGTPETMSTRDLAGLLHLQSQHLERCTTKDDDGGGGELDQPMTVEELIETMRALGPAFAEAAQAMGWRKGGE